MGSPLYGMPTLSFFETTSIFRLDDTVKSVEILQGGPSVVFAGGQMGATANFLLKTGTDTPAGSLGLTYGDENLWRVDGFYGFPLGEGWYGSVGGFWRVSDGVRDPQFTADDGGQLTATLKHEADAGDLMLYARYLDDKNQFITPIPVIQNGTDSFSAYPGFDPLTATYNSKAIQHVRLDGYPNGGTNADLAEGRGAQMLFVGAELRPRVRQRLVDHQQVPRQRRRRRYQRAVLRQQSGARCSTSCTPSRPISAASGCRLDRRRRRSWAAARWRPTRA